MTTTFVCEDGFTLPVRWEASNFAHLCGLDYYTDGTRTRRYPYVRLYEHMVSGKRISERQLSPNGDPRWLPYKAEAIIGAFHLDKAPRSSWNLATAASSSTPATPYGASA